MKKILCLLMLFGSLAAQETDKKEEPAKAVPQITVNADEFKWAKDIIFNLALENQKLQGKKDLTPLDFGYGLIQDNFKLKNDIANLRTATGGFVDAVKNAKTMAEVKKVLTDYGVK
jgi:hypothetical protein